MELSLGIRLVIIFPTLLFLTGYIFKGIIERKNLEKMFEEDNRARYHERRDDFFFIFGIESIFLFVANGLIIIFELQETEVGVISVIVGIIFSMGLLVGTYAIRTKTGISASTLAFILVFGLLTGQLGYFISYGTEKMIGFTPMDIMLPLAGSVIGIFISVFMAKLVFPHMNKQSQN